MACFIYNFVRYGLPRGEPEKVSEAIGGRVSPTPIAAGHPA
jgi:hypothetical protein